MQGGQTSPDGRPDLTSRGQVDLLVTSFYREVVFDDLLEPVFSDVAEVDWARHIPVLVDYWSALLLGDGGPGGPIMQVHRRLHAVAPIEPEHCDRWYSLWVGCVDERWSGSAADRAKRHAGALMAGMARRVFGFEWSPAAVAVRPLPGR